MVPSDSGAPGRLLLPRRLAQVALNLDRKSIMSVTLADKSLRASTVQPPGQGEAEQGKSNDKEPSANAAESGEAASTLTGRNFIESWPLDLSAFLGGETSVSVHVGTGSSNCETTDSASTRDVSLSREGLPTFSADSARWPQDISNNSTRPDAPSAPEGFRYIKLSVSLPRVETAIAVEDGDPAQAPEGGGTTQVGSVDGDTTAIATGEGTNGRKRKFLSTEAMERLNPLSITISSAASLPGVRIEAESLQSHVKPTHFRLLDLYCKPVYVVCRPFPDDPSGETLHSRILWTAGSAQQDRARFEHTTSFLVGPMDRHRLEDWVENSMLSVEIHDR